MSEQQIRELIAQLERVFAKTYADKSPHEYAVVKPGHPQREATVAFMDYILTHGEKELYFGHPFIVFKIDGRKYWSMAKSSDDIDDGNYILNRSMMDNVDTIYS